MIITKENLNDTLADAVMDRPREFFIGRCRFCLWSPTLGMTMMMERHLSSLDIDYKLLSENPSIEALRLATAYREEVCYILAILSFRRFFQLSNSKILSSRARYFSGHLSDEELAQLLLMALSVPRIETLSLLSGIADDQKAQSKIVQLKNKDGHNRSFGGKSIYGLLIDTACKAYGWTKEYVVWGIDFISLRLMLADSVNSIYLSDDDIKSLGFTYSGKKEIYGMTPEDIAKIKAMDCWN